MDLKTSDGFLLRIFVIGFTKRRPNQVRKNCYAQHSQVLRLRKKMFEIISAAVTKSDLQSCVKKFQLETIGKDIETASSRYYPLRDVHVRKVKVLHLPKFEPNKLLQEVHGGELPKSWEEGPTGANQASFHPLSNVLGSAKENKVSQRDILDEFFRPINIENGLHLLKLTLTANCIAYCILHILDEVYFILEKNRPVVAVE